MNTFKVGERVYTEYGCVSGVVIKVEDGLVYVRDGLFVDSFAPNELNRELPK